MLDNPTVTERQAILARAGLELGWTQAEVAEAFGLNVRTVQRRLKLLPGGKIPTPVNVVGSGDPGWQLTDEVVVSAKCPRCRGDLDDGDYCLGCNTYQGYEQSIKDALRLERAKRSKDRKAARFRPRGAPAESVPAP